MNKNVNKTQINTRKEQVTALNQNSIHYFNNCHVDCLEKLSMEPAPADQVHLFYVFQKMKEIEAFIISEMNLCNIFKINFIIYIEHSLANFLSQLEDSDRQDDPKFFLVKKNMSDTKLYAQCWKNIVKFHH